MRSLVLVLAFFALFFVAQALEKLPVRRQLSIKQETQQYGKLDGGGKNLAYYVEIKVGSSANTYDVAVDTGSGWLVLLGKSCKYLKTPKDKMSACKNSSDGYVYKKSKNFYFANCSDIFDDPQMCPACDASHPSAFCCGGKRIINSQAICQAISYYNGNLTIVGDVISDVVKFGNLKTNAFISVGQYENGQQVEAEGILGLGYSALSSMVPTWMDELVENNNISNAFSLCLGSGADEGGYLVIGGADSKHHTGDYTYTSVQYEQGFYVTLQQITINGVTIDTSAYDTVIDSGSSLVQFPEEIFEQIQDALLETCHNNVSSSLLCGKNNLFDGPDKCCSSKEGKVPCVYFGTSAFKNMPRMGFTFPKDQAAGSFTLNLNASDYVRHWWDDYDTFCGRLGFAVWTANNRTGLDTAPQIILGDSFLKAYNVLFDRTNARIGFATPKSCGKNVRPDDDSGWSKSLIIALVVVGGILAAIAVAIVGYMIYKTIANRRAASGGYSPLNP